MSRARSNIPKLAKSKAELILNHPFFATLLLQMKIVETKDEPTMATDGETIYINPEWTESLLIPEAVFVLAHEIMHCVFDHMGTKGNRDNDLWNQACDYVINDILVNSKVGQMPKIGLYDPKLVAQGKGTAPGVYNLLPKNSGKKAGQPGGALDRILPSGSKMGTQRPDPAKAAQQAAEMKVKVIQAKNAAKMQGKLSAGIERLIDDLVKSKTDWREVLRKFFTEKAKVDVSYARPKRRFMAEDFILPSLSGFRMGKIVIPVDCSRSVDNALLRSFAGEINAIREDLVPSEIEVIYFDSEVCGTQTFGPEDEVVLKPMGGGGTDFKPVFDHIAETMQDPPVAVVFLTDLYCNSFGPMPDYPVMWAVPEQFVGKNKAPFGEILSISLED